MSDLSRKVVVFWDASGSYTHMAEAVVSDYARVLYYVPYESGFPSPLPFLPGYGVEGLERIGVGQSIEDFWDAIEIADLVVFTDVGNGGLQEYLRSQGIPVFGSGRGGRLEQDRLFLRTTARNAGLDVAGYFPIRGVDALRELFLGEDDIGEHYIKLSYWRGLAETFHHTSPFMTRSWLDELSLDAGPYANEIEFLVELPINEEPCIEVGIDTYSAEGLFPDTILWGYEADKDNCFVGSAHPLPRRLAEVANKLSVVLQQTHYRGPLSTETRECPEKSYIIDFTARFPEPPSSLQRFMVANLAEIYWETANGRIVEPNVVAPIGVQIVWKSAYGARHPVAVNVGRWDRVTVHGHACIDGQHYAVSPAELEEQGGAVGLGSTVEAALEDAIDAADSVEGREVKYDSGALEKIAEAIQKGNDLGLEWGKRYGNAA